MFTAGHCLAVCVSFNVSSTFHPSGVGKSGTGHFWPGLRHGAFTV